MKVGIARYVADIAVPIALYYVLHAAGVSILVALSAGAAVSASSALADLIRTRRVDAVSLLVLASFLATIAVSLAAHNARFVLAKDAVITAVWGCWFLFSVGARRPAAFVFARPLMEGRRLFGSADWDQLWQQQARFRRIWRVSSAIWGIAFLLDAVLRVTIAYHMPLSEAPAANGALWPATFVLIQIATNVYYHRAGLYQILGARWVVARAR
jgi:intracellular septation protein A